MRTVLTVLLAVLAVMALPQAAGAKKQIHYDRIIRNKRTACEKGPCSTFVKDEGMNCVNNCTSSTCYLEVPVVDVYEEEPLEDGELDDIRNLQFTQCVRKEAKMLAQLGNRR